MSDTPKTKPQPATTDDLVAEIRKLREHIEGRAKIRHARSQYDAPADGMPDGQFYAKAVRRLTIIAAVVAITFTVSVVTMIYAGKQFYDAAVALDESFDSSDDVDLAGEETELYGGYASEEECMAADETTFEECSSD